AMRRGIPAAGCEIGGRGGLLRDDVELYLQGLRRVLARRGLVEASGLPAGPASPPRLPGRSGVGPGGGVLPNPVSPPGRVGAGAPLATIVSPLGTVLSRLTAAADGIVMGVRHLRSIQAGEWATCVVTEAAL